MAARSSAARRTASATDVSACTASVIAMARTTGAAPGPSLPFKIGNAGKTLPSTNFTPRGRRKRGVAPCHVAERLTAWFAVTYCERIRPGNDMSRNAGFLRLALLLAALASLPDPARAQTAQESAPEAARKEREVVWYTAMNIPDAEPVRKLFQEKYPYLNLTILRQPGEKIRTRILTETRAGKFFWDVVSFNHLDMDVLNQEGLLASYDSPETRSGFPKGAVDPEGRWAAIYVRQYVIGYNTRSVPRSEAPKSWQYLLQAKWKEKFAMDESEVEWYAAMLDYLGGEKSLDFMRALARQNPPLRRGHSPLSKLPVAGGFPPPLVHAAGVEEAKRTRAPGALV